MNNSTPFSTAGRWAHFVGRFRLWIVTVWIVVAIVSRLIAPSWDKVAYDGDFDYLPATMTSVAGANLLNEAFPGDRTRSQIVLVLGRDTGKLSKRDEIVGLDLLRRLYHQLAIVSWQRAIAKGYTGGPIDPSAPWGRWLELTRETLDQAITIDVRFYEQIASEVPDLEVTAYEPRLAIAYWDRGLLLEQIEGDPDQITSDYEAALVLYPELPRAVPGIKDRDLKAWSSLLDVLSWQDPILGTRLSSEGAKLVVLQLSSELAATENIGTIEALDALVAEVMAYTESFSDPGLKLLKTGSAAIGGETLIAAREAIRYTELFTVIMILGILVFVYRAPLLVAVPMISIGLAVVVSTAIVTMLTEASANQSLLGMDLRVFTTSRIFVVVILFGAGTDYCLFLIARLREEAIQHDWDTASAKALSGVMGALMGSALTTIIGLGMLWIADFGKFHYTGPIIALCLLVGLFVCTTFTPALLQILGPKVFWPTRLDPSDLSSHRMTATKQGSGSGVGGGLWPWIALFITRHPGPLLVIGMGLLLVPAVYGWQNEDQVTYDLSSELDPSADSRQGLTLLESHFNIGEINPVTVLVVRPEKAQPNDLEKQTTELAKSLYKLPSVIAVRTADDPLGDFPPQREMGLLSGDAWRRRALRNHRVAKQYFYSSIPQYENRLSRFDVIIQGDPFSEENSRKVAAIETSLRNQMSVAGSPWEGSTLLFTGTTPSIMDLRTVTLQDNRKIKIAVVVAVFLVLMVVIRRVGLCLYLIATVLLSYYATLGLSLAFFHWSYGDTFVGIDWKLPLFLFVILVAVGQDYNVYLVARVIEEQKKLGWIAALRKAVSRTGGIITACGLVMAATFFSMTAAAWFPPLANRLGFATQESGTALRSIIELGFALGLGVLIDTFYVRTILVPSYIAITGQWKSARRS